jgi:hypothetical protein
VVDEDSEGEGPPTLGRAKYVGRLNTIEGVRRELARLYIEARRGELRVGEASKLGNLLFLIGRLLEGIELETRVQALEARHTPEAWRKGA